MKVIKQSQEILNDSDDLVKQIELRGRICYKSESKITKTSAKKFVKHKIEHGHSSVLEMGVLTLEIVLATPDVASAFVNEMNSSETKYLIVDRADGHGETTVWITASVRAFREWTRNNSMQAIANAVSNFLTDFNMDLFFGLPESTESHPGISVSKVDVDEIPDACYFRHKHVAVKFTTNRAVTHELVRHRPVAFLQESQRYCRYENEVVFIEPTAFAFGKEEMKLWEASVGNAEVDYQTFLREGQSPQAARTVLPNSCKTEIIVYCSLREWSHIFCLRTSAAAEPSMAAAMLPVLEKFKKLFPGRFDELVISVG